MFAHECAKESCQDFQFWSLFHIKFCMISGMWNIAQKSNGPLLWCFLGVWHDTHDTLVWYDIYLFRPVSITLQVQSKHTLQVQDETLCSLHCCFGQDMSSSMRGCTVVWAQEGKEILIHVAAHSTVTIFHREFNGHRLLPILHPLRLCLHWSKPNDNHSLRKWFRVVCVPFLQV